jgi:hypothetical protein
VIALGGRALCPVAEPARLRPLNEMREATGVMTAKGLSYPAALDAVPYAINAQSPADVNERRERRDQSLLLHPSRSLSLIGDIPGT